MRKVWAKTKILVYNKSENEDKYKEMEKMQRLGLPTPEMPTEAAKEWTDYAFCLDDILDFFKDVDTSTGGGTKALTVDGRTFTIKADFMQVFLSVIERYDEVSEDEDWEIYYV